jgi:hypothetical protein
MLYYIKRDEVLNTDKANESKETNQKEYAKTRVMFHAVEICV